MENFKITSNSPEETIRIAKALAKLLNCGDTVVLTGDLGAGKTKFVEGFLSNFNLQDEISSPTFNIVNEYEYISENDTKKIFHFDVYRLEDSDEFYAIGGDEYFDKGICLIEWGETMEDVLPEKYIQIVFSKDMYDENKRILEFKVIGDLDKLTKVIENLKEELN